MTITVANQMAELAKNIQTKLEGGRVDLTDFPSGGVMLDIHRADGRLFVMSYTPSQGFGVDEVRQNDGSVTGYQFAVSDFDPAADRLRELMNAPNNECRRGAEVALNLVVVHSRDIEASQEFYSQLGLEFKREKHGSGPEHYAAVLGDAVFEIYPCHRESPQGGLRLGFRLPSVDRAIQLLEQWNIKVHTAAHDSPWGRRAVVEDPDGNQVELTEKAVGACDPS